MDLGRVYMLISISTQGHPEVSLDGYVKRYKVEVSEDDKVWMWLEDKENKTVVRHTC